MDTNNLSNDLVKALVIRNTFPLNEPFDATVLDFLAKLYLWRRPEKFFFGNGYESRIKKGYVGLDTYECRILTFEMDNGYIWKASLKKVAYNIEMYQECCLAAEKFVRDITVQLIQFPGKAA